MGDEDVEAVVEVVVEAFGGYVALVLVWLCLIVFGV